MKKSLYILFVLLVFTLSGCGNNCTWCKKKAPVKPKPVAAAPAPVKPQPAAKSECGVSSAMSSLPCEGCAVVKLEKNMPVEVPMNTKFDYTIKVMNPTGYMVSDVVVTENLANTFKLADTDPKSKADGGKLTFDIGMLEPGQTKAITISGMATSTDCLKSCATVNYTIPTCASVKVVQPALKLVKTAPASVLLCEAIPVKFVVTNTGSGSAGNVKIEDALPAGLKTVDGKSTIMFDAGTLAAGQSREFFATLNASKTGKYDNTATASSSTGLKAEASTTTEVHQPVLTITKTAPENIVLGREITYSITVNNKGDAAAANTMITDMVPSNAVFVKASDNGRSGTGNVVWDIGSLSPNASKTVTVTYKPTGAGEIANRATAKAVCAQEVTASAKTTAKGVPGVLLEMVDLEDPIVVGNNVTYVITITNQGFAPLTNLVVKGIVPEGMKYVSSSGATIGTFAGDTLTFAPVATLAPKAKLSWQVIIKATAAGDRQFKVTLKTDELSTELQKIETTNLYE
jgi:uncharacterized repeat protein (TIGR01451 family)